MLDAERQFRRIIGYRDLATLAVATRWFLCFGDVGALPVKPLVSCRAGLCKLQPREQRRREVLRSVWRGAR
jgi:hypothetical protein